MTFDHRYGAVNKYSHYFDRALLAIYDLRFCPYAYGEILYFLVVARLHMLKAKASKIDVVFFFDFDNYYRVQPFANNADNAFKRITPMLSLINACQEVNNVTLATSYLQVERIIDTGYKHIYPDPKLLSENRLYYRDHYKLIKEFMQAGYFPEIHCKQPYTTWARKFYKEIDKPYSFIVQMRRMKYDKKRNAQVDNWHEAIKESYERYPEIKFIIIGHADEIPSQIRSLPNVLVSKDFYTDAAQDCALIELSDAYIGSISGMAVMAMYTWKPFSVFWNNVTGNNEQWVAGEHPSTFTKDQQFMWGEDTPEAIKCEIQRLYNAIEQERIRESCCTM